jgi:MinD-like ATPase involved in chromosome partitioning or flagellar assembly
MDNFKLYDLAHQLRQQLNEQYRQTDHEWVELTISTNGAATITVVSHQFKDKSRRRREDEIRQFCAKVAGDSLDIVWLTLLTPDEAVDMGFTPPDSRRTNLVGSWLDFAYATVNAKSQPIEETPTGKPRVIVFYSYKGGVGRTTAMLHVAYLLAQRGRRIVMVDMDLEAPGLRHAVATLTPDPTQGLVDYLYERQLLAEGMSPTIHVRDIVGRVQLTPAVKGEIYVVPAGRVDLNYISKVDDLDSRLGNSGPQAWLEFLQELSEHLTPDLIFIDSRTGFNRWGAISLLLLADEAFIFAYPNQQNMEGLKPLLIALKNFGRPPITFVLSLAPNNPDGTRLTEEAWQQVAPLLNLPKDPFDQGDLAEQARPVIVLYDPVVATTVHLPLRNAEAYRPLAIRLDNVAGQVDHIQILTEELGLNLDKQRRQELVKSIKVPTPFAEQAFNPRLFQQIEVLDRILQPKICLIRGRKGTGKSYLFRMFQTKDMQVIAGGRMDRVGILPVQGSGTISPDATVFEQISGQIVRKRGVTWETFWSAHALLQLWMDQRIRKYLPPSMMSLPEFEPYKKILAEIPQGRRQNTSWISVHTQVVLRLAGSKAGQQYMELFRRLEERQRSQNRYPSSTWLLYDNLEFSLPGWDTFWTDALEGLFRFVSALDERSITWLRPKIFLREDLWQYLKFPNKSHFESRQVELKWQKIDLLRLAYRLLTQSGAMNEILYKHYQIEDLDRADEETLVNALGLVWGLRRALSGNALRVDEWLYRRMTDAAGATYPREMIHLLTRSRETELNLLNSPDTVAADRLLRSEALDAGLIYASERRCEALSSEEYSTLAPFFAGLKGLPAQGDSHQHLLRLWRQMDRPVGTEFPDFLELLKDIGLLTTSGTSSGQSRYEFAPIYIDGFGLERQVGQPI